MLEKIGRVGLTIIACLMMWFSAAIVEASIGEGWMRDIAVLAAFGATIALWLILALPDHKAETRKEAHAATLEKAKRDVTHPAGNDPRLALLLELMDEDERRRLKARLVDELSSDGAISLADLLAAQDSNTDLRQHNT